MLENLDPERLAMMQNMLLAMDPPRHLDYRRPLAPSFKARVIAQLETRIRTICREIMARADRHAAGRLVSLLEGGYDLQGLAFSVAAHVGRLMKG